MHLKFKDLVEICLKLRAKGGCPWDQEQTIESLKACVLEEAQEVAEAIESGKAEDIQEEIGDLLFTLVMMTNIAAEDKKFDMKDVLEGAAEKLVRRHTWVFGTDKAETAEEALELWMKNKEKEKKANK
ncbi:nucleotide pyrophosphohydrolase [Candidatus Peregrinibacteria bacterium]|jgi:tetrapyrrole methylase family protein / MazG family protein|nr:nucleotide pyrophosphohydrolase [Candidatus Peregrinibacteria bacterium]MBT4631465.1 nucleotide pyrophosphohydrolase [Candidatus Peregrinibacteria bacterium]MBT5516502.1 nucleotide pyrophosphohydrolase [Candidatus Peregrinibacteria bacterium]MBT5823854.1 nucleotide pyrophosphohydrolase [Candidatus Peregrinibacteria bacterium]